MTCRTPTKECELVENNELERSTSLDDVRQGARARDPVVTRSRSRTLQPNGDTRCFEQPPPSYSSVATDVPTNRTQSQFEAQNLRIMQGEQRANMTDRRLDEIARLLRDLTITVRDRTQPQSAFSLAVPQANANPPNAAPVQARPAFLQPAKLIMPTFAADCCDKPIKYLKNLREYIAAVGITEGHFKHVIRQSLRASASEWWEHIEAQVETIAQFEERFKNRFWSRMHQVRKREELEFGYYDAEKNQSRSEYIIAIYNQIKALDEPPAEIDMVDKFSRHFDDATQNAIIAQRIVRVDDLIEFLDRLDNMGKLNANRISTRPVIRKEPYWTQKADATTPTTTPTRVFSRPNTSYDQTQTRSRPFTPRPTSNVRLVEVDACNMQAMDEVDNTDAMLDYANESEN